MANGRMYAAHTHTLTLAIEGTLEACCIIHKAFTQLLLDVHQVPMGNSSAEFQKRKCGLSTTFKNVDLLTRIHFRDALHTGLFLCRIFKCFILGYLRVALRF